MTGNRMSNTVPSWHPTI